MYFLELSWKLFSESSIDPFRIRKTNSGSSRTGTRNGDVLSNLVGQNRIYRLGGCIAARVFKGISKTKLDTTQITGWYCLPDAWISFG